jgi:Holliday junction resolvase
MPSKSKIKGNNFERWIVNFFEATGLPCRRAWGSDGRSMGLTEGVDGTLNEEYKWQAKCKAQISPFYIPNEEVDFQIFKGNRTNTFATMSVQTLAEMINRMNELYQHNESLEMENKELKDSLYNELK